MRVAKGELVRVRVLYTLAAAAVVRVINVSIIYCLMVAGKYPFLSLQKEAQTRKKTNKHTSSQFSKLVLSKFKSKFISMGPDD